MHRPAISLPSHQIRESSRRGADRGAGGRTGGTAGQGGWAMKGRWALAGWLGVTLGCMSQPQTTRSQKDDEPEGQVRSLGDVSSFANSEPVVAWGVGLVGGLDGTGSAAPPGQYRAVLEAHLKQVGVEHLSEFLT